LVFVDAAVAELRLALTPPETMTAASDATEGSRDGLVLAERTQGRMLMIDAGTEEGIPAVSKPAVVKAVLHSGWFVMVDILNPSFEESCKLYRKKCINITRN
jgi:hypothetical protein